MDNIYTERDHKTLGKKLTDYKLKFDNDPKMKNIIDDKLKVLNKNNIIEK